MKRLIKPVNSSKAELGKHSVKSIDQSETLSIWIDNKSPMTVELGTLDEEDLVLNFSTRIQPNEKGLLNINSAAILAIGLNRLPPEGQALFFANGDSLDPDIQIADDTDDIHYPIRIGIAADIFNQICWEDFGVAIVQASKYPVE